MNKIVKVLILSLFFLFLSCKEEKENTKIIKNKIANIHKSKPDYIVKFDSLKVENVLFNGVKMLNVNKSATKNNLRFKAPTFNNKSTFVMEFFFVIDKKIYDSNSTLVNLLDYETSKGQYGKTLLSLWFSKRRISGFQNGVDLRKHGEVIDRKGFSEEFLTSKELKSDQLYKLTYSYRPGTVKIYIDDEIYATYKNIKPSRRISSEITLGSCWSNNKEINHFYGKIGEIKFFLNNK